MALGSQAVSIAEVAGAPLSRAPRSVSSEPANLSLTVVMFDESSERVAAHSGYVWCAPLSNKEHI